MNIYLITGVAGFIGSHLSEALLEEGAEVYGIDNFNDFYSKKSKKQNLKLSLENPRFHFIEGDICDNSIWENLNIQPNVIFHLAANAGVLPSIKNSHEYLNINILGTNKVFEFMQKAQIKNIIYASSSSVYGNNKKVPFSELDNVDGAISPYAVSKKSCEVLAHCYSSLYNFSCIGLRFFTVIGPRQRPDLAIRKFVDLILEEKPILMYGDGSTARDYTYVGDIISGILKSRDYIVKKKKVFEIFNLGNSTPITLSKMISTIYTLLDKQEQIIKMEAQPGDVNLTYADISKAKNELGYNPETSFEKGVENFIKWYKSNNN